MASKVYTVPRRIAVALLDMADNTFEVEPGSKSLGVQLSAQIGIGVGVIYSALESLERMGLITRKSDGAKFNPRHISITLTEFGVQQAQIFKQQMEDSDEKPPATRSKAKKVVLSSAARHRDGIPPHLRRLQAPIREHLRQPGGFMVNPDGGLESVLADTFDVTVSEALQLTAHMAYTKQVYRVGWGGTLRGLSLLRDSSKVDAVLDA